MIVLDTSVVSFIFKGDSRARYYQRRIRDQRAFVSFQTVEEQWYGAYARGWGGRRKNELARHLEQYEIVWPSPELVEICASLRAECRSAGREIQVADAWVAATALMLKCPLASHDGDFKDIPDLVLIRKRPK